MTIHYNGDYSGPYIVSDIRRDKSGEQIPGHNYKTAKEIHISDRKFISICKKMLAEKSFKLDNSFDVSLKGKEGTIKVNSGEMVDFYLDKMRNSEMEKLEQMSFKQLVKRYSNG